MELNFSFIVPVYNRPQEIRELLESMVALEGDIPFEVVIVEDGSQQDAGRVIEDFRKVLTIRYLVKENSGPGPSRNYGMARAAGNYFIILDSDCLLPPHYLGCVKRTLEKDYTDCFGGPDKAHHAFSAIQKAIDFSMTSFWTTGGIRGGRGASGDFEPRSFNMGLSAAAFAASGGFGNIHPGEDPDLSIRLRQLGYRLALIPDAFVYHKRRISYSAFFRQVRKFGLVRPILTHWHPESARITYWLPSLFILGAIIALILGVFGSGWIRVLPALGYLMYFLCLFVAAWYRTGGPVVAAMAVLAAVLQFTAYGTGFLKSTILVTFSGRKPNELFPQLFY